MKHILVIMLSIGASMFLASCGNSVSPKVARNAVLVHVLSSGLSCRQTIRHGISFGPAPIRSSLYTDEENGAGGDAFSEDRYEWERLKIVNAVADLVKGRLLVLDPKYSDLYGHVGPSFTPQKYLTKYQTEENAGNATLDFITVETTDLKWRTMDSEVGYRHRNITIQFCETIPDDVEIVDISSDSSDKKLAHIIFRMTYKISPFGEKISDLLNEPAELAPTEGRVDLRRFDRGGWRVEPSSLQLTPST